MKHVPQEDTAYLRWFRFPSDFMTRTAVRELGDFELRMLVALMSLASRSPSVDRLEGALTVSPSGEAVTLKYIQNEVWTGTPKQAAHALDLLERKRLISRREDGAYVVEFGWQQYASDSSTKRVQAHRQRKAKAESVPDDEGSRRSRPDSEQNRAEQSETFHETFLDPDCVPEGVCPDCLNTGRRQADGEPCGWCGRGDREGA